MKEQLVQFLLENGYGEETAGFGHATAEAIAEGILAKYTLVEK